MTKEEAYEAIKAARIIASQIQSRRENLPSYDTKPLSQKTIAGYLIESKRLSEGGVPPADILHRARLTTSIRTWHRRRAALIYTYLTMLKKLLSEQDSLQRNSIDEVEWLKKVKTIKGLTKLLTAIENEPAIEKINRKPTNSKKKDLRGLPADWREQIYKRMPNYRAQILTLALTGCRPAELAKGVHWEIKDGKLIAKIEGVKLSKFAGQEMRTLTFPIIGDLAEAMQKLVDDNDGELTIDVVDTGNLTRAIRSAAQRAFRKFKKSVTAYSFRHQAAADWKAAANSSDSPKENLILVSAMLGHATNLTKGRYGHSSQSRGSLMPEKVEMSRAVKIVNKASFKKAPSNTARPK